MVPGSLYVSKWKMGNTTARIAALSSFSLLKGLMFDRATILKHNKKCTRSKSAPAPGLKSDKVHAEAYSGDLPKRILTQLSCDLSCNLITVNLRL